MIIWTKALLKSGKLPMGLTALEPLIVIAFGVEPLFVM